MIPQPIIDIAEICARKKIENAVVSPGSRSAPLTISFVRNPAIKTWIFPDERSAAYVACGMSAFTKKPTVVICTSGTAALNLAPAIAEAYYQQIPLIVLTADRPAEWIDQYDNQTIRQYNLYGAHVKKSYVLPMSFGHPDDIWFAHRTISEAINISVSGNMGPVHINVPLREPLYPSAGQTISPSKKIKAVEDSLSQNILPGLEIEDLKQEWEQCERKLIVAGQCVRSEEISDVLWQLHKNSLPVVSDITSNLHQSGFAIRRHDIFLNPANKGAEYLKPDLLITWGKTVLSKNLKLFLRGHKPLVHWHIQKEGVPPDTFQSLTRTIHMEPVEFFRQIASFTGNHAYAGTWKKEEEKAEKLYDGFITEAEFGEFKLVDGILKNLPSNCNLHLANSMSVRYANLTGLKTDIKGINVYSNRGTSGIDGCTSFAVGTLLASGKLTILITGDMAFFYDRNAFWHNYPLHNLRVILLNNHGGLIFRLLDGPNGQPELEEYFETRQRLNARHTAEEFGFDYYLANENFLQGEINRFFQNNGKPKILEIETTTQAGKKIYDDFKNLIKEFYGAEI